MAGATSRLAAMGAFLQVLSVFVASLPAWPAAAIAAGECRYAFGESGPVRLLRVGEVDRRIPTGPLRLRNLGPHDVRLEFSGAGPRQLPSDSSEPAQGHLPPGVALRSVECLPSRRAGRRRLQPARSGLAHARRIGEHAA